jgi:F0F1-type ATP synthase delta subunit
MTKNRLTGVFVSKITTNELAMYAVDQLETGVKAPALAQQLAAYLLEERRSRDMSAVMRAIDEELARRGSAQVTITAAHEVSEQTKKQLATLLDVKNPQFTEVIDPSVIGGVKARSGESEIDLTVRGRLNRFKINIVNSGN